MSNNLAAQRSTIRSVAEEEDSWIAGPFHSPKYSALSRERARLHGDEEIAEVERLEKSHEGNGVDEATRTVLEGMMSMMTQQRSLKHCKLT